MINILFESDDLLADLLVFRCLHTAGVTAVSFLTVVPLSDL